MKRSRHNSGHAFIIAMLTMSAPVCAQTSVPAADAWTWRATLYGWFPSIHGSTNIPNLPDGGSIETSVSPSNYLSRLQFAFMGSLEARRGPWSILGDAIYLDMGNSNSRITSISGPGGHVAIPIDSSSHTDLKGFVGMLAAGYSVLQQPGANADVTLGARYLRLKSGVDWELSGPVGVIAQNGSAQVTKDLFDGIVGVRGNVDISDPWFFRYYVDAGAGSSRFTWQALAGIGYRLSWGEVLVGYRHLAYDFHSDRLASDIKFSGPVIGVAFKL